MTIDPLLLSAIWLTLKLATLTTLILLLLATPLAWWMARTSCPLRLPIQALVTLPLVLPPSVLGFYLLVAMGPDGPLGAFTLSIGWGLLSFTFGGLLLGSIIFSLPFAIQPILHAFQAISSQTLDVAATLGASPVDRFFNVALPLAKPGLITAAILSFAHTVGEFGVVLMIGGNIPAHTQLVSTKIYGYVEAMQYQQAHLLSAGMLAFAFGVLMLLAVYNRRALRLLP